MSSRGARRTRSTIALIGVAAAIFVAFGLFVGSASATYPGTNGPIAYVGAGLALHVVDGGNDQVIATGVQPDWSPDGTKLAFSDTVDIWTVNADGSDPTNLTNNPPNSNMTSDYPSWSPAGDQIAFSTTIPGFSFIDVMDADGLNRQTLKSSTTAALLEPAWDPSGNTIVYSEFGSNIIQIVAMNSDGSGHDQLTNSPLSSSQPDFSPDGSQIVFARDTGFAVDQEIWVMNADGSNQHRLNAPTFIDNEDPSWSPDGTEIVWAHTGATTSVVSAKADGSSSQYTTYAAFGFDPDWGPTASPPPPVDETPPTTAIALDPALPDGLNSWYVSPVGVTVSATDDAGGSGVAETRCVLDPASVPASFDDLPSGCAYTGAGADVTSDGQHTVYAASKDNAGNTSSVVNTSFQIDQTAPTVTCATPPAFTLGSSGGTVSATVTDNASGPVASPISAPVTSADTASVGAKTKPLTGYDNAGNQSTVNCSYIVGYQLLGFFSPLPKQNVNAGSSVTVKFALADNHGTRIPDSEAQALVAGCKAQIFFTALQPSPNCFRYDTTDKQFVFNLKTPKAGTGLQTITAKIFSGASVIDTATTQINLN